MEGKSFPSMTNEETIVTEPKKWVKPSSPISPSSSRLLPISPLNFEKQRLNGPQREISSSSLSELSSPISSQIKTFDVLVSEDLTKLKARSDFIRIIGSVKVEYDKTRDLAIKYYEQYQNILISKDSSELSNKTIIGDLKKKLATQHQEQMSYLEEYSSMSEFSDSNSENSLILDDF